ncbi:MAG: LysR family transcriptional regulator [Hyphomicrobiales bacterium]|nr:LysR family transcriptional regulator [Hyphomicrobiales bacterium]
MDISLARTFLAVAEAGSFMEAAARLHVTQSTISSRIKALESQVGKALLARSKAGAALTPAGQQFHKHALALVRVWEHARLEVGLSSEHRDHLAAGGQASMWEGFLLRWAAWMREHIPDIAVTGAIGSSAVLMDRLIEGTLDLAVMYRPTNRPGLVIEHVFDEEFVLVASAESKDRRPAEYVFVNWGPEFKADHALAFPELAHPGLALDVGMLPASFLVGRKASGYFPLRAARPHIDRGELKIIKRAPRFLYPVYVVYPEDRDEDAYQPILDGLRKMAAEL